MKGTTEEKSFWINSTLNLFAAVLLSLMLSVFQSAGSAAVKPLYTDVAEIGGNFTD